MAENKVRDIHHASGGDFGGIKVNAEFEHFLDRMFGEIFMKKFKDRYPTDWLETINEFEIKKRSPRASQGLTRIRLPANFASAYRSWNNGSDCRSAIARLYQPGEVKINRSEFLCIDPSVMKNLFDPVISEIVGHLKSLLKEKPQLSQVELMFLVGGFAESPLLQSRIRAEFGSTYKILVPTEAKTAVLRGAVMFGRNPNVVEERILAETYGTSCYRSFIKGYDDPSKLERIEEKATCKDTFRVLAEAGEMIRTGDRRRVSNFTPLRSDQKAVGFDFYTTTNPGVRYVTDEGVKRLSALTVASPDTSKGVNRKVELNLYFGGTEIKVTAVDLESKSTKTVFVDFLAADV